MATNPYFTQLHTQRFSFIGSPQQRNGTFTKDQRFLNMYPELISSPISDGKKYYLKKRPGVALFTQYPSGAGRGIFYWLAANSYLVAIGNKLYMNSTAILTMNTSAGNVGFAEFKNDSEDLMFFCDGLHGYTITPAGVVSIITDSNFPTPHIPTPIFLDGYIFLASPLTQTIHNSMLLDPTTWPSDGFIDAEMFPDYIQGLAKVQNYIAAVGTNSIEWFYDNANATGSPLQRNAPAVSQFGTPAPGTVVQTEKELILVGQTANGGRTVWLIDGFQPKELADAPVREALDLEGINLANANAYTLQCSGHKWYVLNLLQNLRTFVYDFDEQMWHEWTTGSLQQQFFYGWAADSNSGSPILLHYNDGSTVTMNPGFFDDRGQAINCVVTTVKIDFDTVKRKRIYRLSLVTDGFPSNAVVPMTVSWSDDDYNTFTPGTTLNISGGYSTITQLGYTRRRAFRFQFTQAFPLRLEAFELDITQEVRR